MAGRRAHEGLIRAALRAARRRQTPFYLFDRRAARETLAVWSEEAQARGIRLFYPFKCNRHPALLRLAANAGLGAEVTARTDLEDARARGLIGQRLLLQGPAKDPETLDEALATGAWIVADGPEDARAILERARALGCAPRYLLRLRPAAAEPSQGQFGLPRAGIVRLARELKRSGAVPARGLAFHLGTGLSTRTPYRSAFAEAGRVARELAGLGIEVSVIDGGGGFASRGEARRDSRGRPRPAPPPTRALLGELAAISNRALPGALLFLEPGRALAADAFALVARVVRIRDSRIYVDASRASHALFVPRGRHPVWAVPARRGPSRSWEIAGPLPVDLDVLSASQRLGPVHEGDLLVIGSVGAYNQNAANAWAGAVPEVVEFQGGRTSAGFE